MVLAAGVEPTTLMHLILIQAPLPVWVRQFIKMEREGFEPSKTHRPVDLQSTPFNHSGTSPKFRLELIECAMPKKKALNF